MLAAWAAAILLADGVSIVARSPCGRSGAGVDPDPRRVAAHQVVDLPRGQRALSPGRLE